MTIPTPLPALCAELRRLLARRAECLADPDGLAGEAATLEVRICDLLEEHAETLLPMVETRREGQP